MDRQKLSEDIWEFLRDRNPKIKEEASQIVAEINNQISNQSIIVQITDEGIWVRLSEPQTAYFCESYQEFEHFTNDLLLGNVEVAVGYNNKEWQETVIIFKKDYSALSEEFEYRISSWAKKSE